MPTLQSEEIKKLKHGELWGKIALVFCAAACVYFVIGFSVAQSAGNYALRLSTLITAPILLAAGVAAAAFCNLKYGRKIDAVIKAYARETFIANAALMHPERENLTFYISLDGNEAQVKTNNFKEKIVFDFSAFGKLTATMRAAVFAAITEVISNTFCRLLERDGKYGSVSYALVKDGKTGKTVYVITDGAPDKRAYKNYSKANKK